MLKSLTLGTGETLFVEVEDLGTNEFASAVETAYARFERQSESGHGQAESGEDLGLPEGTRLTSVGESQVEKAADILESQISALAKMAYRVLEVTGPEEIHLEAHVKFAGDAKIIPFIASAKADGGLKLKLVWKKPE